MNPPALLILEDGTVFHGESVGADGLRSGEVVFNTAITGYQEILTDPSYAQQLVTLTHPHIGNTGATTEDQEADAIFCAGLIVKDIPLRHSNWRAESSFPDYLRSRDVVAVGGIDTRKLTRILRSRGAQRGAICAGEQLNSEASLAAARAFPGLGGLDLAKQVSCAKAYDWRSKRGGAWDLQQGYQNAPPSEFKVVAYDYGVKHNILRMLAMRGCAISVVPAQTGADAVLAQRPDGVFLSNGPGDPEPCQYAVHAIKKLLDSKIPIFGICLGHQLLALACGGKTEKMKFGHHGANHPVRDLDDGRVLISSQNHGFAVAENSLPDALRVTHRSLFDNSIQGIAVHDKAALSFQGHPEASPGPHDCGYLFARFIEMMRITRVGRSNA